jgi:hypothetical protein
MHAFTAYCESYVDAIIDEERDVVGFAFFM